MPTTRPSRSTSGPPELPGLIDASVWIMASAVAPPVEGADDPGGHGAVEAEWRSDGDHRLTDPQVGADAEPSGPQVTWVGAQHGDVVVGIAADYLRGHGASSGEHQPYAARAGHHMAGGEHVTFPVYDDSRAATAARAHLHDAGQDLAGGGFGGAGRGAAVGRRPPSYDPSGGCAVPEPASSSESHSLSTAATPPNDHADNACSRGAAPSAITPGTSVANSWADGSPERQQSFRQACGESDLADDISDILTGL